MPSRRSDSDLKPRDGEVLQVAIVARISGGANQKELSLEDQVDHAKEEIAAMYSGPVQFHIISTTGKGERNDRPELAEWERLIRTRTIDITVMEDVGRLVRGVEAVLLWGIAVDHGTRCIAPNDCCDTADETWEEDLITACRDHVGHNAHTSRRLKKKLMNRFRKFGGSMARPISGYIVPDDARTYDDWVRDEARTADIRDGAKLLRETLNCSLIGDWLNDRGFPTGPYSKTRTKWNGNKVRKFYANPILKGWPSRGGLHTVKHHESGHRVSVPNPAGPTFYEAPHLAHLDAEDFDELNALLTERNKNRGRKPLNGTDPRFQVPRSRTAFPGQHVRCWYCGRICYWGANGMTSNLKCSGPDDWECWHSVSFSGPLAVERIMQVVTQQLEALDGFDDQLRELVGVAGHDAGEDRERRRRELDQQEAILNQEKNNLLNCILKYGDRPMTKEKLDELEARERDLRRKRMRLEQTDPQRLVLPRSAEELRTLLQEELGRSAVDSPELARLLRLVVPEFYVYSVRLCDGGHLLPRAVLSLDLAAGFPDVGSVPSLAGLLRRTVTLDLFDRPPQRERIREEALRMAAEHPKWSQARLGANLSEQVKQPVVQKALALQALMEELGLSGPYVIVREPPNDYPKLRRHKHPRYAFKPLDGYIPPPL